MPTLLAVVSPLVALVAVEVSQLDGTVQSGQLLQWNDQQIVLQADEGPVELTTDQVLSLRFRQERPRTSAAGKHVVLRCGSVTPAVEFTSQDGQATFRIPGESAPLSVRFEKIQAVRFRAPSPALDEQWNQLTSQVHEGDVIVIRKSNTALDSLEGIIRDVSSQQLAFELDGERIDVPLTKLEGIIPFNGSRPPQVPARGKLTTTDGAVWQLAQVALLANDNAVQIQTPQGVAARLPLDRIQQVDFAAGNVQYLSHLTPLRVSVEPLIAGDSNADTLVELLYAPRQDESLRGAALALLDDDGRPQTYAKGLAIHSRTELLYALDGPFGRLRGLCGIAPDAPQGVVVSLKIFANDQLVFDELVESSSPPIALDLPIEGARRLRLLVDYGDDSDLGDHLHLCNLRVTK